MSKLSPCLHLLKCLRIKHFFLFPFHPRSVSASFVMGMQLGLEWVESSSFPPVFQVFRCRTQIFFFFQSFPGCTIEADVCMASPSRAESLTDDQPVSEDAQNVTAELFKRGLNGQCMPRYKSGFQLGEKRAGWSLSTVHNLFLIWWFWCDAVLQYWMSTHTQWCYYARGWSLCMVFVWTLQKRGKKHWIAGVCIFLQVTKSTVPSY